MLQDKVPSSSALLCGEQERRTAQIYHLRYIAQDCKDWKTSDLEAIKRGMEVSILKYRLAKELAQEAREVLDDMLTVMLSCILQIYEMCIGGWLVYSGRLSLPW